MKRFKLVGRKLWMRWDALRAYCIRQFVPVPEHLIHGVRNLLGVCALLFCQPWCYDRYPIAEHEDEDPVIH